MRKTLWGAVLAAAVVLGMALSAVALDSMPASKAAAQVFNFNILEYSASAPSANPDGTTDWVNIMSTAIKTANQKDLFIDVSLQSSLYTRTQVKSRDMNKDTSTAQAGVQVRVLVDGVEALPGTIVFNDRYQELSATLQGQVDLVDSDGDGVIEPGELQTVAPEEIELLLSTISANAFNFVAPDVTSGVHQITIQARIDVGTSAQAGSAEAEALIGAGSVTVEEVRMVKDLIVELGS